MQIGINFQFTLGKFIRQTEKENFIGNDFNQLTQNRLAVGFSLNSNLITNQRYCRICYQLGRGYVISGIGSTNDERETGVITGHGDDSPINGCTGANRVTELVKYINHEYNRIHLSHGRIHVNCCLQGD